jgi:hypothetical protein
LSSFARAAVSVTTPSGKHLRVIILVMPRCKYRALSLALDMESSREDGQRLDGFSLRVWQAQTGVDFDAVVKTGTNPCQNTYTILCNPLLPIVRKPRMILSPLRRLMAIVYRSQLS